ncbi:MAG: 1,4-alpha-glucan branching protein GlgB [Balneolaceae bacterium]|nr:1,4-alpha-glucan branching protein GlgB [Balneolaceae bacterium]
MAMNLTQGEQKAWQKGTYHKAYHKLGAHLKEASTAFSVWAPNAVKVSVVGDFNKWNASANPMKKDEATGIWTGAIPEAAEGDFYKFAITSKDGNDFLKIDPMGFYFEKRPRDASVIYDLSGFDWQDDSWMAHRPQKQAYDQPISIYEVHLGSWKKNEGDFLSYHELADQLIPYVVKMGFTHIELMPICEHPYDPSWGYQVTGFFAPTSRYGEPKDFMHFVDECHKAGIGVIMDWVPGHFPKDEQGLHLFDGTPLYEYEDSLKREQKDWGTSIFDYEKAGVRNFLISSASFWLEKYHIDGLRMDAIASILYLDYSKEADEWKPNKLGGKENLEAVSFLKDLNAIIHEKFSGVLTFAEESSAWPGVTKPVSEGGLGFDYKWNMGWMNDTLSYLEMDAVERKENPEKITFPIAYAKNERFVLPLSHDEVVHLKKPLALKAPGEESEKLANLRLLYTYMIGHPGKKLLFMGGEFAQTTEWAEHKSLDWQLLENEHHKGVKRLVEDLLKLYSSHPALFANEQEENNFEWIDLKAKKEGLFSFIRTSGSDRDRLYFILNFSDRPIQQYQSKFLLNKKYDVILNSDSEYYGGMNTSSINNAQQITLAPFSGLVLSVEN